MPRGVQYAEFCALSHGQTPEIVEIPDLEL